MATRERDRDRELLIPVAGVISEDGGGSKSSSGSASPSVSSSHHHTGREAFYKVVRSWASKKFMTGCVILLPMAITFYTTWWFIHFVDGFFSPIYTHLGINIFGLGFITSITFIFLVGVFMSSWLGASVLGLGTPATPTTPVTPTTPTTPVTPAPKGKPTGWCVPKADVSDAQLQSNLDYACSQTIDCAPIRPGGACYDPNTVASHAAYAMNLLYQTAGRNPWNCDFSQTATVTSNNPSYNACIYPGGST